MTKLVIATLAGGSDLPAWRATVLQAGMPPMVTAGVVAVRAGLDADVADAAVLRGLVLAVVTLPVLRGLLALVG